MNREANEKIAEEVYKKQDGHFGPITVFIVEALNQKDEKHSSHVGKIAEMHKKELAEAKGEIERLRKEVDKYKSFELSPRNFNAMYEIQARNAKLVEALKVFSQEKCDCSFGLLCVSCFAKEALSEGECGS